MTDGIIQEVFKRYWENEIKTVHNMEQELIEKIKQKRVWQWDAVRLRDLIGDNQE